jgi:hypothetical protein
MFSHKGRTWLWIGLASLITLSVVAAAQKGEGSTALSQQLKQASLKQPTIKPAAFPVGQQSRSLAVNRRALSVRRVPGPSAALDNVKLPATGKASPSRGFSRANLASSAVAAPPVSHQVFNGSELDVRKLRAATRPDLGNRQ